MLKWERDINGLMIIILCGVLLSAFGVQFIMHEKPCPLCMLQRIGMIGVATGGLLNIWYGIHMSHYGVSLLSALAGGFVALRQISLHVCPGMPEFGMPVLGLSLYTWSFVVFTCVVLGIALLLFMYNPKESAEPVRPLNLWCKVATGLLLLVAVANVFTTYMQCGFGPCQD